MMKEFRKIERPTNTTHRNLRLHDSFMHDIWTFMNLSLVKTACREFKKKPH